MTYLIPAPYTGMSSYTAHLKSRTPPSQEPGTDYYMDRGTPLRAPTDCRVVDIGGGVGPATGRFITLDDGTRWLRFLHLLEWRGRVGQTIEQGEVFALSGSSGYGSEFFGARGMADFPWGDTGGPHVHVTAFRGRRYEFNTGGSRTFAGAVDFHALTGGAVAGHEEEKPDMDQAQNDALARVDAFVKKFEDALGPNFAEQLAAVKLFDGIPGINLERGRLAQALDAAPNLLDRFIIKKGKDGYDLSQLAQNQFQPMLLALVAAIGRNPSTPGAPIDPKLLVDAIREALGDELAREVADELAARLAK